MDVSSYAVMIKVYKRLWDLCGQFSFEEDPFDFVVLPPLAWATFPFLFNVVLVFYSHSDLIDFLINIFLINKFFNKIQLSQSD